MARTCRILAPVIALLLAASLASRAEEPKTQGQAEKPAPDGVSSGRLPGGIEVEAARIEQKGVSEYLLEGAVTIRSGHSRIQADRVRFHDDRYVEAEGNVLVVWGPNRISGTKMSYDLKEERGRVDDAVGQIENDFFFAAESAEKIGEDLVLLKSATVTTCTQPVPYWSFAVSTARVHINHYAHMWNPRLRAKQVPIFYLPYLIWPVKQDRAAGLMLPSFGTTRDRGTTIEVPVFVPLGDSADITIFGERYSTAGTGWGGEFNFIPNGAGRGALTGFMIWDKVADFGQGAWRYRFTFRETQKFLNGFRMVADIDQVSDFQYFSDFERDLRLVSSPTILTRVEFSRNGDWTSVNIRELRRKQQLLYNPVSGFANTQIQATLPEIELRGRSRKLGRTPFYLAFESSGASIQQRSLLLNADYLRGDAYPTISLPFSPRSWLDVNPSASYRLTYYTKHRDPETQEVVDEALMRRTLAAGIELVGPKIYRIFQRAGGASAARYKHTFETRVAYQYQQAYDRPGEILQYDDVDLTRAATNQVSYGFGTRLFAQRPRARPSELVSGAEAVLLPQGMTGEVREAPPPDADKQAVSQEPGTPPPPMEPVEIASFEVRQSSSFGQYLSIGDADGDRVREKSRQSPVEATGRFNPSPATSLDLRTSYDVLFDRFRSLSLSGTLRGDAARLGFSLVRTSTLTWDYEARKLVPYRTQLRLATGVVVFGGKLRLDVEGSYDPSRDAQHRFPDQRWRMELYTQCCGFLAEYLKREYIDNRRGEFRLTMDLRGIGKLLDFRNAATQ